jgi:hypothetical protein
MSKPRLPINWEEDARFSADYSWLIHPMAKAEIVLGGPSLNVYGNRFGIMTLANIFLWLAGPDEYEYLSISGLPFMRSSSGICLYIRLDTSRDDRYCNSCGRFRLEHQGTLMLMDKHMQYEWRVPAEGLSECAVIIHEQACGWDMGHYHVILTLDSVCELCFQVDDI